ncbi:hypothetical protein JCM8202_005386 [Rhodotorula sphaerocarpa]
MATRTRDDSMMHPSSALVRPEPYSLRATTTSSHPQLRDLLVHTPEDGPAGAVFTACYDSLCSVDCYASRPPEYSPLRFSPSVLAYGMGLVAAGGQSSEIALKSASPGSEWCFQHLPAATNASATGVRTLHSGSINNSIFICPSPTSPVTPRVLVSSNDEVINVYEVAGTPPNYRAAKRRRERQRRAGWSVVEATWAAERGDPVCAPDQSARGRRRSFSSDDEGGEDDVEEQPSYEQGQSCHLVPKPHETIRLNTAVNHCSVSPDGKWLIAVGDTNEVFLYSAPRAENDQYELAHTFTASSDASFSTDWNQDNQTFAVASQDGFVHVFDIRSLPSCSRPASPTLRAASSSPRKVAELKTTQSGPAGAARKVKFSPGGRKLDGGLLAFTEHRNRVHIVDARNFETYQVLDVPLVASQPEYRPTDPRTPPPWASNYLSPNPPPLRPRPQPPPRAFRSLSRPSLSRLPSASFSSLASFDAAGGGSGTCTPRDEKERDDLEREMRERSERRVREEDRRLRVLASEVRRERRRLGGGGGEARQSSSYAPGGSRSARRSEVPAGEVEEDMAIDADDVARDDRSDHEGSTDMNDDDEEEEEDEHEHEVLHAGSLPHDETRLSQPGSRYHALAAGDLARGTGQAGGGQVEDEEDDDDLLDEDEEEEEDDEDGYSAGGVEANGHLRLAVRAEGRRELDDDGDEDDASTASSINTTRPRRFGHSAGGGAEHPLPPVREPPAPSRQGPMMYFPSSNTPRDPTTHLDPPVHRNFAGGSGYTPLARESLGPIRLPSYLSHSRLNSLAATSSGAHTDSTWSTFVPSSFPSVSVSFAPSALPRPENSLASLFAAPLTGAGTYHATSAFFPLDSTPGDLLGLDWDEWGERVFVATGERVWEWEVDARARRGSASWSAL